MVGAFVIVFGVGGWHVLKFHSNLLALANHIKNVGYKPNDTS